MNRYGAVVLVSSHKRILLVGGRMSEGLIASGIRARNASIWTWNGFV